MAVAESESDVGPSWKQPWGSNMVVLLAVFAPGILYVVLDRLIRKGPR